MTNTVPATNSHSQQFEAKTKKLASSPKKNKVYLDKKPLPMPEGHVHNDDDVFTHEFTRNDIRGLIHSITQELKIKGVKTALVLLAFRPKTEDHKLTEFLATVIPNGTLPAKQTVVDKIVKNTDEFTLVAALKYLWARLPMNAIIGWDAYDSFKKLESRDNYPKKAFLEFMPQCLSSPSHASIVYDFLDLIVSFAANSKDNQLSGRKIAKMAGIWAFHGPQDTSNLTKSRLDPTENTFVDGLRDWLPAADAMFHLLLSFLRSMLPEDHSTKLQLPRTLQALLASNSYPPPDMTYSSTTLVSVPLVTIKTNVMSASPVEMLNRVPKVLTFENPDMYQAKEDYALLKSLCRSDDNILNKLSTESRRIVEAMCQKSKDSNLKPGWPDYTTPTKMRDPETQVTVSRVSLDDYFIWTWLASMSFEETVTKKKLFGRALISEVVFDGFKKWIIVEEQNTYANVRNHQPPLPEKPKVRKVSQPNYTSMLDGLPEENVMKVRKPRAKKEKALPVINTAVNDKPLVQQRSDSTSSKLSFLNPLKKLQQHHNEPLPAPVPQNSTRVIRESVYQPPEQIEPLPEIKTNQYRLSIPLESFGFDADTSTVPPTDYNYSYDDSQYQSLAPQQQHQSNFQQQQRYTGDEADGNYNYWSSEPRRSLAPPPSGAALDNRYDAQQPLAPTDYDNSVAAAGYDNSVPPMEAPHMAYNQPGYKGSIENLTSMVDEMTVQVGQVENKLGNKPAPMWDVQVPLPQDQYVYSEPPVTQSMYRETPQQQQQQSQPQELPQQQQYRDAPQNQYEDPVESLDYSQVNTNAAVEQPQSQVQYSSMLDVTEKPRRKPPTPVIEQDLQSATGSSVYGPTPIAQSSSTFAAEESVGRQKANFIPGTEYPVETNGYMKKEDVPQIQVPHPKRESQEVQPVYSDFALQPSMVDEPEQYQEYPGDDQLDSTPQNQRYSHATTAHESYYSAETLQRGETPYTDASEMKSPLESPGRLTQQSSTVVDQQQKRQSNKYPESIIDSYQMSIHSSPQKISQQSSPAKSNRQSMNAATAASMRASMALSMSDAHYIPEADLSDVPAPAPVPKSPLAQKRQSFSPDKYADVDVSRGSIDPIPPLDSRFNESMDSFPTQADYITPRQTPLPEQAVLQVPPQEPQQRPQRKAPVVSPVRDQIHHSPERLPLAHGASHQDGHYEGQQSYAPSSAQPVPHASQHQYSTQSTPQYPPQSQQQVPQLYAPQSYQDPQLYPPQSQVPQYNAQQAPQQQDPRQNSPNRSGPNPAVTPQRPTPQQQGAPRGPVISPVGQRNGSGAYPPAATPNRVQNLAPPGSGQRRTSPSGSFDSRGGSPYRPQGGAYPHPHQHPQNGYGPSNGAAGGYPSYAQRPRQGSASSLAVPQGGSRQASPLRSRPDQHSHAPVRPGSAPSNGRGRSPQHGGQPPQGYYTPSPNGQYAPPPQGWYPPPQGYYTPPPNGQYPPQGYPPQGWYPPPQGYSPQGYPAQGYPPLPGSVASKVSSKPSASELAMQSIPGSVGMNKLHHKPANKQDKKNMRNALAKGDFGI